ncbi:MAG: (2Fe-2S)-binding protein [Acidobacteriota bacterium]
MSDASSSRHCAAVSRRSFLKGLGVVSAAVSASSLAVPVLAETTEDIRVPAEFKSRVTLRVNGASHTLHLPNRMTLLEALRDELELTGAKQGCGEGQCGACTVLVDAQPVYACSQLAVTLEGRNILTIEGLESNGRLDPVQQAFIDADAMQCGYCIPGQIMSARALLNAHPEPTEGQIRAALCGNLCRCGTYMSILAALRGGAKRRA